MNTTRNAFLRQTLTASACAALALALCACSPEPQGKAGAPAAWAAPATVRPTPETAAMPTQQGSPTPTSRSPNPPRAAPLASADQWRPDGARVLEPTISSQNASASPWPQAYYPRQNGYGQAPADSWRSASEPIGIALNASDYPPPPLREYMGPAPGYGYQWIDGHWAWHQNDWAWSPGYWISPPAPNRFWIAPRYERRSRMIFFAPGHWSNEAERPAYQGYAPREDRDSRHDDQDRRDWREGRDDSLLASPFPQIQNGQGAWSNTPRRDAAPHANSTTAAQPPGERPVSIAPAMPILAAPPTTTANSAAAAPANGSASPAYGPHGRDYPPRIMALPGSAAPINPTTPSMGVAAPAAPLATPATALPNAPSMGLAKPAPSIQAPPAAAPATPVTAERQDPRTNRPSRPIEAPRPPAAPTPPTPMPAAPVIQAPAPSPLPAPAAAAAAPVPKPAPIPVPAPPAPIIAAPFPKPATPAAPPAPPAPAPVPKPTAALAPPPAPAANPSAPADASRNVRENRCAKPPCEAREPQR